MKTKTNLYIAYDSNINPEQMAKRCPTAEVVCTAILKDYDLLFRGSRHSARATVEPLKNGSVPVLIWKLKPQDERALDLCEGWSSFYRKKIHEIELDGEKASAIMYVMKDGHGYGEPSGDYFETIYDGYESVGFYVDYLDQALEQSTELAQIQDLHESEILLEQQEVDEGGPNLSVMRW